MRLMKEDNARAMFMEGKGKCVCDSVSRKKRERGGGKEGIYFVEHFGNSRSPHPPLHNICSEKNGM